MKRILSCIVALTAWTMLAMGQTTAPLSYEFSGQQLILTDPNSAFQHIYYSRMELTSTDDATIQQTLEQLTVNESSQEYGQPIAVQGDFVLKAIGMGTENGNSEVLNIVYLNHTLWMELYAMVDVGKEALQRAEGNTDTNIQDFAGQLGAAVAEAEAKLLMRTDQAQEISDLTSQIQWLAEELNMMLDNQVTLEMPEFTYDGLYLKIEDRNSTGTTTIYYTLDGTEPTTSSWQYNGNQLALTQLCTAKAIAADGDGNVSEVAEYPIRYLFDQYNTLWLEEPGMADAAFQWCGSAEGRKRITAVKWFGSDVLQQAMLQGITNPNLLVYATDASLVSSDFTNVIVNGMAKRIVLSDLARGTNNFYCPESFTAEEISYTHNFGQQTQIGVSRGWETLCLPFDVQTITHETHGTLAPFGSSVDGKPFWLYLLKEGGATSATEIVAGKPYLISMPNNSAYPDDYNQAGNVTFYAHNALIEANRYPESALVEMTEEGHPSIIAMGTYSVTEQGDWTWALNVGQARDNYAEGSVFEQNLREVRPFEVYVFHEGDHQNPSRFITLDDLMNDGTAGINELVVPTKSKATGIYDLQGRKVGTPMNKGVYIIDGKKVIR